MRLADGREMRAGKLVLMTDGRSSLVRKLGLLPVTQLGAPMDVLWFRLPKADNPGEKLRGAIDTGRMAVMIDRRTYWQAAFIIPKGTAETVKARGVGLAARARCRRCSPSSTSRAALPRLPTCTCSRLRSTGSTPGIAPAFWRSATQRTP